MIVAIAIALPAFLIVGLFISLAYCYVGWLYISSSRELKRIGAQSNQWQSSVTDTPNCRGRHAITPIFASRRMPDWRLEHSRIQRFFEIHSQAFRPGRRYQWTFLHAMASQSMAQYTIRPWRCSRCARYGIVHRIYAKHVCFASWLRPDL